MCAQCALVNGHEVSPKLFGCGRVVRRASFGPGRASRLFLVGVGVESTAFGGDLDEQGEAAQAGWLLLGGHDPPGRDPLIRWRLLCEERIGRPIAAELL